MTSSPSTTFAGRNIIASRVIVFLEDKSIPLFRSDRFIIPHISRKSDLYFPPGERGNSPSEGERERYAVPASLDAAGEIDPGFRPSEGTPPYGSSPFTKENVRNPAGRALICAANHARKRQRHTKKESVELKSTLSFAF